MGSLKKKFAKTLRKVTPKEIAPILPFLAMAIPGMQGLSPLLKFALPQLLTAAGSARQTGKINLMNQAVAGLGSLASINSANAAAAAGAPNSPLPIAKADALAAQAAGTVPLDVMGNAAGTPVFSSLSPAAYANANPNPDLYSSSLNTTGGSTVNNAINNAAQFVGNNQFVSPLGDALNSPGLDMKKVLAIGSTGGSLAAGDYAGKKQLEFDEEEAAGIASIDNYRDARGALTDYFANQNYSLEDLYGVGNVPSFLAANGGRAQLQAGGGADMGAPDLAGERANKGYGNPSGGLAAGGAGGAGEGGNKKKDKEKSILMGPQFDPNSINIEKSLIDLNGLNNPKFDPYRDEEENYGVFGNYLKDIIDNKGFKLSDNLDLGINKTGFEFNYGFADGGRTGFSEGSDPDMDRVTELELQGFSYEQAFEIAMKELMNRADGGRIGFSQDYNQGGRVPYNNGGIMQAPGVPSGMELDYRSSGGFIPMGGPEKADDVPAMLSKNEFVMTADAVRAMGNGDVDSGAQKMYDMMNNLEAQV